MKRFKRNLETEFILQVELGEEKLLRVSSGCPGLCLLAVRIPGTEEMWNSGQPKLSGGSFYVQWKVAFFVLLSKPSFRERALCSVFSAACLLSVSCISPLSDAAKLSKGSFQSCWCFTVGGGRAQTPWRLPPAQFSLARRYLSSQESHCTPVPLLAFRSVCEAPARPRTNMEPSLEEILELAGDTGGLKGVSTAGWKGDQNGSVSLAQIPKVLDKTECFFG